MSLFNRPTLKDLKIGKTLIIGSQPISLVSLDEAIEQYRKNYEAGDYSGFLKLSPSLEKELRQDLEKPTHLYRAVALPSLEELDLKSVGIYWTYNKDKAKAYWGEEPFTALLIAPMDPHTVDWMGTVEQHMKPQYAGEDEIRLKPKTQIRLKEIQFMDAKGHPIKTERAAKATT